MTEILETLVSYLRQIYNFSIYKSMVIMFAVALLYFFGCGFVPKLKRKITGSVIVSGTLFSFYISQVIGITLLNRTITEELKYSLNIVESYKAAFSGNSVFRTQLIGNIIMFVPLGILVPVCFKRIRGMVKIIFISFLFSLFIEITQLYTHVGIFELVDLSNNTLGGIIGYCIFRIFYFMGNMKYFFTS